MVCSGWKDRATANISSFRTGHAVFDHDRFVALCYRKLALFWY